MTDSSHAAEYVRKRGTVVAVGLPANAFLKAPVFASVIKMVNIKASYVGNRRDTAEAIEFYTRGLIKPHIKVVPFKDLPDGMCFFRAVQTTFLT